MVGWVVEQRLEGRETRALTALPEKQQLSEGRCLKWQASQHGRHMGKGVGMA